MATDKKPPSISKHKSTPAQPSSTAGEAFDIIPPEKVTPSPTARPIITPTGPNQADNTLANPPTAPLVRKSKVIQPSRPAVTEGPQPPFAGNAPYEAVSAAAGAPEVADAPSLGPLDVAVPSPDSTVPAGPSVSELLSAKRQSQTAGPAPPDATAAAAEAAGGDDRAAEPLDTDMPSAVPAEAADANLTASDSAEAAAQESAQTDGPSVAAEPAIAAKTADDSLQGILSGGSDTAKQSSPAARDPKLQAALQDLETSPEGKHPHEAKLYGGKPVIIVHEPHPLRDAVNAIAWVILILIVAAIVVDLLLDAGVIALNLPFPHTNFLGH